MEKYISQTLESVIGQTYKQLEIIAVNDGSKDNTLRLIEEYAKKDPRIVVFSQPNKGLSAARNAGFKVATGEYLCIIDADDVMMPEKIESQFDFLERNPFADFTYSKVRYFSDETKDLYVCDLDTPNGTTKVYKELLRQGNLISPNSVFFRKSVFDTVGGFDETLQSAEDLDYWLFLSGKGITFLHQDKYLTLCRMRKDSMTANSVTMYSNVVAVFEKYIFTGRSRLVSKIIHLQYLKNSILLELAKIRKPKPSISTASGDSLVRTGVGLYVHVIYELIRKTKFRMRFKKMHNSAVHGYLLKIESTKIA